LIPLPNHPVIHLTIRNHFGSVEHYYHFLLGFMVPLVNWYTTHDGAAYPKILIRSCAILDSLILELAIPNLVVLDKEEHRSLVAQTSWEHHPLKHIHLDGYDNEILFDRAIFTHVARDIKQRLGISDAVQHTELQRESPTIVVIGRKQTDPYYLSAQSEIHSSGSMRRSIPNLTEIVEVLQPLGEVHQIYLEGLPFKEQIRWFMRADMIVAQHGAALGSLIFCREGTAIVEILPPNKANFLRLIKNIVRALLGMNSHRGIKVYKTLFGSLSRTMHLHYDSILQKSDHSPVPAEKVFQVVRRAASLVPASLHKAQSFRPARLG
jgi:hypothetical protein